MKLGIYGAGGMGREVMLAAQKSRKWDEIFFIVDPQYIPKARSIKGCRVFSLEETKKNFSVSEIEILICVGEPSLREKIFSRVRKCGLHMGCFIDPSVELQNDTVLGEGVIILHGCILSSDVAIGDNSALSFGVILGHDNKIGKHCYIAPAATIGGCVTIEDEVFVGLGSTLRENCTVGASSIIGQGAVVVKNIPSMVTVVGNPAKQMGSTMKRKVFNH